MFFFSKNKLKQKRNKKRAQELDNQFCFVFLFFFFLLMSQFLEKKKVKKIYIKTKFKLVKPNACVSDCLVPLDNQRKNKSE